MNNHQALLQRFYTAFARGHYEEMATYYHEKATFEDPAFGILNSNEVKAMWRMLLSHTQSKIAIHFSEARVEGEKYKVQWTADYLFSSTHRPIHNKIVATFEFKDDKIYRHKDNFNLYRWACQALGWKGYLWGWTTIFKKNMQQKTRKMLNKFMALGH